MVLPLLITEKDRKACRLYRQLAIAIEEKLEARKQVIGNSVCVDGEDVVNRDKEIDKSTSTNLQLNEPCDGGLLFQSKELVNINPYSAENDGSFVKDHDEKGSYKCLQLIDDSVNNHSEPYFEDTGTSRAVLLDSSSVDISEQEKLLEVDKDCEVFSEKQEMNIYEETLTSKNKPLHDPSTSSTSLGKYMATDASSITPCSETIEQINDSEFESMTSDTSTATVNLTSERNRRNSYTLTREPKESPWILPVVADEDSNSVNDNDNSGKSYVNSRSGKETEEIDYTVEDPIARNDDIAELKQSDNSRIVKKVEPSSIVHQRKESPVNNSTIVDLLDEKSPEVSSKVLLKPLYIKTDLDIDIARLDNELSIKEIENIQNKNTRIGQVPFAVSSSNGNYLDSFTNKIGNGLCMEKSFPIPAPRQTISRISPRNLNSNLNSSHLSELSLNRIDHSVMHDSVPIDNYECKSANENTFVPLHNIISVESPCVAKSPNHQHNIDKRQITSSGTSLEDSFIVQYTSTKFDDFKDGSNRESQYADNSGQIMELKNTVKAVSRTFTLENKMLGMASPKSRTSNSICLPSATIPGKICAETDSFSPKIPVQSKTLTEGQMFEENKQYVSHLASSAFTNTSNMDASNMAKKMEYFQFEQQLKMKQLMEKQMVEQKRLLEEFQRTELMILEELKKQDPAVFESISRTGDCFRPTLSNQSMTSSAENEVSSELCRSHSTRRNLSDDFERGEKATPTNACKKPTTTAAANPQVALSKLPAFVKGFLVRRYLKTQHVQNLIQTIKETSSCLVRLHQETPMKTGKPSQQDIDLHKRLLQQLTSAFHAFHDAFFKTTIAERMHIIAADRQRPPKADKSATVVTGRKVQPKIQRKVAQKRIESGKVSGQNTRTKARSVSKEKTSSDAIVSSKRSSTSAPINLSVNGHQFSKARNA
ncbi:uncharacterized protein LOC136026142 [Artemia franciscana]|uniref:uncharacterized protein LOC136026142 n=1 Tax=Artemia franciscana TaxID=6661 RepID=UPI0032DA3B7C